MRRLIAIVMLITGLIVLSSVGPAPAMPLGFKVEGALGVWAHKLSGDVRYEAEILGLDTDLDLGAGSMDFSGWLRFEHPLPFLPDVKAEYVGLAVSGETVVKTGFQWGDRWFGVDVPIESEGNLKMVDLTLYWHLPFVRTFTADYVDITLGLSGRYLKGDVTVRDKTLGIPGDVGGQIVLPLLYGGIRVDPIKYLALIGEFRGIGGYGYEGFEAIVEARVYPIGKWFFISLGYRHVHVELPDIGDLGIFGRINGVFSQVGFAF